MARLVIGNLVGVLLILMSSIDMALSEYRPAILKVLDWCLIPDIIDGTEQDNKDLVERWQGGLSNTLKAVARYKALAYESLDWLEYLSENFECELVAPRAVSGTMGDARNSRLVLILNSSDANGK